MEIFVLSTTNEGASRVPREDSYFGNQMRRAATGFLLHTSTDVISANFGSEFCLRHGTERCAHHDGSIRSGALCRFLSCAACDTQKFLFTGHPAKKLVLSESLRAPQRPAQPTYRDLNELVTGRMFNEPQFASRIWNWQPLGTSGGPKRLVTSQPSSLPRLRSYPAKELS